jgi:hypothetical protein
MEGAESPEAPVKLRYLRLCSRDASHATCKVAGASSPTFTIDGTHALITNIIEVGQCFLVETEHESKQNGNVRVAAENVKLVCNIGSPNFPYNHLYLTAHFKKGVFPTIWGIDDKYVRSNCTLDNQKIQAPKKRPPEPEDGLAVWSVNEQGWAIVPFTRLIWVGKNEQ